MDNVKLLLKLREQQITQLKLANLTGIANSTISEIIRGRRKPTEEQKNLIADYLKVSVKSIFPDN